ncbi:MAG: DegV family protein, partial [Oscillospiraceae bacterium]|nr:DegV family protein [Oscillospiraceae bacterium]
MRIVTDSSSNLTSMENTDFLSVPMIVRLGEREYLDTPRLRVDVMMRDIRASRCETSTA